jgi:hypothetical protein
MASTTFIAGTVVASTWLNDVNDAVYDILGDGTNIPATKADARTNLGLGTIATQNANAVAITGGSITGLSVTVLGTAVASTSGTSIDFTSIPSWVRKITLMLAGVSTGGTGNLLVQLGDAGGVENTGYLMGVSTAINVAAISAANNTSGFQITTSIGGTAIMHGKLELALLDSATNTWVMSGIIGSSAAPLTHTSGGSKALSATLDRIRLTTVGGADTFDSGLVNIQYE